MLYSDPLMHYSQLRFMSVLDEMELGGKVSIAGEMVTKLSKSTKRSRDESKGMEEISEYAEKRKSGGENAPSSSSAAYNKYMPSVKVKYSYISRRISLVHISSSVYVHLLTSSTRNTFYITFQTNVSFSLLRRSALT